MTNGVIDFIIRIKNGYMSGRDSIETPFTNLNEAVAKKLLEKKYITDYKKDGRVIKVTLSYSGPAGAITDVLIFSKPGRRYYVGYKDLQPVLGGMGCAVLSTPQGIMTDKEAKKAKIGGELLFKVW
ncbi:30S ribosomal protein S8 [Candidatus Roizmanbacteria bacterium]|nr:30S ribosomal protein S8 [Candidatus Roizmanbacteria bacterium]